MQSSMYNQKYKFQIPAEQAKYLKTYDKNTKLITWFRLGNEERRNLY